jgi:hypothetical protein
MDEMEQAHRELERLQGIITPPAVDLHRGLVRWSESQWSVRRRRETVVAARRMTSILYRPFYLVVLLIIIVPTIGLPKR